MKTWYCLIMNNDTIKNIFAWLKVILETNSLLIIFLYNYPILRFEDDEDATTFNMVDNRGKTFKSTVSS